MKRFAVILVFAFLLCLGSCADGSADKLKIHKHFRSDVYVSTGQINFSGKMSYSKDGVLTLDISSPDEVSGYSYTVKENRVNMRYEGLEYSCRTNELPTLAPIAVINTVLTELSLSSPQLKNNGETLRTKLEGFAVSFNKSGYIESISSSKLHITFLKQI